MNALTKRAARAVMSALPIDPAGVWRELEAGQRAAFRGLLELIAGAQEIAPPEPPTELEAAFAAAGVTYDVPAVLLTAIAWEVARYDVAAPGGLMGLGSAPDQVNGAAYLLRRLSDDHGMAGALVRYVGDNRALAGHIAGTMALLAARTIDAGGYDSVRQVLEFLEDA